MAGFEQTDKAVADLIAHADKASPQMVQLAKDGLTWMAQSFYHQALVVGWIKVGSAAIFFVTAIWFWKMTAKNKAKQQAEGYNYCSCDESQIICLTIMSVVFAITALILLVCGLPLLLNPNAYVMYGVKDILPTL